MTDSDSALEAQIDLSFQALVSAKTDTDTRAAFDRMRELVACRSPEQIERMERERGLRA